eukprot:347492-Rhodomonas_salina.5
MLPCPRADAGWIKLFRRLLLRRVLPLPPLLQVLLYRCALSSSLSPPPPRSLLLAPSSSLPPPRSLLITALLLAPSSSLPPPHCSPPRFPRQPLNTLTPISSFSLPHVLLPLLPHAHLPSRLALRIIITDIHRLRGSVQEGVSLFAASLSRRVGITLESTFPSWFYLEQDNPPPRA